MLLLASTSELLVTKSASFSRKGDITSVLYPVFYLSYGERLDLGKFLFVNQDVRCGQVKVIPHDSS